MTALRLFAPVAPLAAEAPEIAHDVLHGLTSSPKSLPPRLFYDAHGSALFERITALPEYYLTRTERAVLTAHAAEMVTHAGPDLTVVELGAGTAAKTGIIIAAILRRQLRVNYLPVDVSPAALEIAAERLGSPRVRVHPRVADYTQGIDAIEEFAGRKLVLYLGSSIGNFEPPQAAACLSELRRTLRAGDALLLGTDMAKADSVLLPAYDDAQGVTSAFNKNVLARVNRELGGAFVLDRFRHVALWNPGRSRIEMHLESTCEQAVDVAALRLQLRFAAGERIHTENSYKYTLPLVDSILRASGFTRERTWSDARGWFCVHLARVA